MWPTPDAFPRSTLCFTEMLGGLFLASADAAQRMQFLVGRLAVGTADNCLRTHILRGDDIVFAADRAELEHRISLLMEASAEGCITIIRHYIEIRGVGVIDVQQLFGMGAVQFDTEIDLVIQLEDWNKDREYDRLGLEEEYTEYLGNKVVCHALPVRPGRNLAVIVEAAAVNHRQKKMGYNAAKELYRRVQENLMRGDDDDE